MHTRRIVLQEERLKLRVDALRQISWCKANAPRLDHCGNVTKCSALVKALAAAPKPPAPGHSDGDEVDPGADVDGEQDDNREVEEAEDEEYSESDAAQEEYSEDEQEVEVEEVEVEDGDAGNGQGHRGASLELDQGQDGDEDSGSELRRGIWSTAEWGSRRQVRR